MKITNSSQAPRPAAATGATRAGASARGASLKDSSTTSVSTDSSAHANPVDSQVSPTDFGSAKVGEISAAIAAGRYQVNAGVVADKLISSAAALAGKSGAAN